MACYDENEWNEDGSPANTGDDIVAGGCGHTSKQLKSDAAAAWWFAAIMAALAAAKIMARLI